MTLEIIKIDAERSYPPRTSEFTKQFWEALQQGKWITTVCKSCEKKTFPPKTACPHCWSPDVEWSDLSERGTLYSWTRIHAAPAAFASETPYTAGIVDLECGIRLACRLVAPDDLTLSPGLPIQMVVLSYQDGPLFAARVLSDK